MDELLNKLLDVLNRKCEHFRVFLDLIKQERELIIRNKTEELQKLIKKQENLLESTSDLERERIGIIKQMSDELNMPEKELTMTRIIDSTQEPAKTKCADIYTEISRTLKEIEKVNKTNAELIKGSLDYIDFSLKTITKALDQNPTYGETGRIKGLEKKPKNIDEEI